MFQKMPNFVFIVLILGLSSSVKGKTPQPMQDQTSSTTSKMLTETKYEIDSSNDKVCLDWVHYSSSRYLVIDTPMLKWSDARRICQELGGDLPIIRSAAENNFTFALVKKQTTVTTLGAWLGFVRKGDKFYWIDDTPLTKGYTAWASDQPDIDVLEKCGNMFGKGKGAGKWNDITCDIISAEYAPVILCKKEAH